MTIVLDASATLAWRHTRDDPREAEEADALQDSLRTRDALVPALWHLEIANALLRLERSAIVTARESEEFLEVLARLPISTDQAYPLSRLALTMHLAREHKLTAYDAAYLELAVRTGSALATFDRKLAQARDDAGVARP